MMSLRKTTNTETPEKPKQKSKQKPRSSKSEANSQTTRKLSFKQQHALETLPKEIERLEFEIGKLKKALAKPGLYEEDARKFNAWASELGKRETLLADKETEWLELELLAEELNEH